MGDNKWLKKEKVYDFLKEKGLYDKWEERVSYVVKALEPGMFEDGGDKNAALSFRNYLTSCSPGHEEKGIDMIVGYVGNRIRKADGKDKFSIGVEAITLSKSLSQASRNENPDDFMESVYAAMLENGERIVKEKMKKK